MYFKNHRYINLIYFLKFKANHKLHFINCRCHYLCKREFYVRIGELTHLKLMKVMFKQEINKIQEDVQNKNYQNY